MASRWEQSSLILAAASFLWGTAPAHADTYVQLDRSLNTPSISRLTAAYSDYTGDGIAELIGTFTATSTWQVNILNGATGATFRQYTQPSGGAAEFGFRTATLPDSDGDGKREVLIGNHTALWSPRSNAGPGAVDALPNVFTMSGLPFGNLLTVAGNVAVIASGDESKLILVNATTGAVQARISNNVPTGFNVGSLGQSAVNVGDLNGDGIPDFASSGGNVSNPSGPTGRVYLLSGAITTVGTSYIPLSSLPAGSVLGQLTGTEFIGAGEAGTWRNTTVNLGDPNPGNGIPEFLLVSGGPWGNSQKGGIAAHVATRNLDGSLTITQVASYICNDPGAPNGTGMHYGSELIDIGDVNRDGVDDMALQREFFVAGTDVGRIEIISGAALLDGFNPATDILQTIDGFTDAYLNGNLQALGDYDNDGRIEFAFLMQFNGRNGQFGSTTQIYETLVPEPTSLSLLTLSTLPILLRRRTLTSRQSP